MLQCLQENKLFEDDLLQVLVYDEFKVYYQLIVDIVMCEIYGYEVLVCWFYLVCGVVLLMVFILVVEKIGFINVFGEWVLKIVCVEVVSWVMLLKVLVNVLLIQLMNILLIDIIIEVLYQIGFDL